MSLKLSVGVGRKVGLPGYSSVQAHCGLEFELESGLLAGPDALRDQARRAHAACARAVDEEIARLTGTSTPEAPSNGRPRPMPRPASGPAEKMPVGPRRPVRPATAAQVQAIRAIARDHGTDLAGLLRDDFGLDRVEELSAAQAGRLIDALKASARVSRAGERRERVAAP